MFNNGLRLFYDGGVHKVLGAKEIDAANREGEVLIKVPKQIRDLSRESRWLSLIPGDTSVN